MFVNVSQLGNTGFVPYTDVLRLSSFSTPWGPSHELEISSPLENIRVANLWNAIANGVGPFAPAAGATPLSFAQIGIEYFSYASYWEWTQSVGAGPSFRCWGLDSNGQCLMDPPVHQTDQDCAYYMASSTGGNASRVWQTQSCSNYRALNGYVIVAEVPISSANMDGTTEPAIQYNANRRRSKPRQTMKKIRTSTKRRRVSNNKRRRFRSRIVQEVMPEGEIHSRVDEGLQISAFQPLEL